MNAKKLLPIIIGFILLIIIVVVISAMSGKSKKPVVLIDEPTEVVDMNSEELQVLGMKGDTEKDTVKTLITLVKTIKTEQGRQVDEINRIKEENMKLVEKNNQLVKEYNSNNNMKRENVGKPDANTIKSIDLLQKKLDTVSKKLIELDKKAELPTGPSNSNFPISGKGGYSSREEVVIWIEPEDKILSTKTNNKAAPFTFAKTFSGKDPMAEKNTSNLTSALTSIVNDRKPFYTIPNNSVLSGSISMTALLGRIPVDGTVTDPYPFKIIIGRDNLMANGIELPNVEGAIVSGTASGDRVLSCVRGNIKSITFLFQDGKIVDLPSDSGAKTGKKGSSEEGIGWLSDDYGIPCVSGEIKSNAAEYLTSVIGLGAAAGAADAIAQSNTTTVTDGSSVTNALTGSNGQYVLGKAISSGMKDTINWFNKRYGQTFDAVYVPPGQRVIIHITKELDIDYIDGNRLVDYGNSLNSAKGKLD